MASLSLNIDPGRAVAGARVVRRELDGLANAADKTERALGDASDAASDMGAGLDRAGKEARDAGLEIQNAGKSAREAANSIGRVGAEGAKTGREVRGGAVVVRRSIEEINQSAGTAQRSIGRMGSVANDNFTDMARRAGVASTAIEGVRSAVLRVTSTIGGAAVLQQMAAGFISMSDEATKLQGRLKLVTSSSSELANVQKELFRVSQETRSAYASNVELYSRAAQATSGLGLTQKDLITFTTLLNQGFALSGATAEEASNAIIQLSQGLASGALRGEEFNSVNEGGARITRALADSLGLTVGQLRAAAAEGKLTNDVVVKGLLSQAPKLAAEFQKVPRTVSDAMVQLRNDMLRVVDGVNQTTDTTAGLVGQIDRFRQIVASPAFMGVLTSVLSAVNDDLKTLNDMFRDAQAVTAWAANVQAKATEVRGYLSETAVNFYTVWKTNYDANLALIGPWVEAWTLGALKVQDANSAAAANSGLSWKGFVDASIDEIATLIAATKALGGIGSDLGIAGTFAAEFESAREMLRGFATEVGVGAAVVLETVVVSENSAAQARRAHIEAIKDEGMSLPALADTTAAATGATIKLGESADEAAKKAEKAGKAFEDQRRSVEEMASSLQRQIDTFDASEGATARLEFTTREMARAWEIAREAGLKAIPPETLNAINAAAGQVEVLTDKLNAMRLVRSAEDEFFPFEKANREAAELRDVLNDTSLSLSDTQRAAVGLAIDKKFKDAASAADGLRTKGVKAGEDIGQSFIENVGDVFADIFSQGVRDGESFFSSILRGFAGLGSQLAAAGAKNLFGKLFGLPQDGQTQSAAGIGSFGTVERSFATTGTTMERKVLPALSGFSSELTAAAKAIRTIESGSAAGNYSAMGPVTRNGDRAYGAYQVMGNNIADWSRSAIGREVSKMEFLRSVELQDKIFQHRFGGYMQKYGAEGASRAWFAGEGGMKNWNARDAVGTSVAGYNSRFGQLYTQNGGGSGFRTTSSIDERRYQKATAAGVKDGLTDYGRQASYGDYTAAGVDPWNMGGQNLRGGPAGFGQTALGALGAGLGIFGQGYQSGSPLQGGFSGALGGYQAAGALGFTSVGAGIAGGVLGAGLGILGGILGARKQREQEHRQKAAAWEQMRPAYEEFDRSLSGEKQGDLRKYVTEGWGQLSSFMSTGGAAWKYGSGNSTAQFDSTGRKLFEGFLKMLGDFRDGFDSMITDMSSGQGLQGAFAKGRNATKELADQIKKTRDDVDIAFGNIASIDFLNTPGAQAQAEETAKSRADAIARYNDAAAKYALSLLYSAEKFSDVQQTIDGLRGTAAGLVPIFADLGWNADEAAKAINDRLSAAIANIARELEQTLADRIDDLNGKGYFATVRDFLDEYAGLQRDFAAAGADGSRLPEFFKLQAQEIVNGAELTGDAFAELIRLFPDLSGVVVEAGKAVGASTAEIADAIKGYEERLFDAQNGSNELARIERKLAADRIEAAKFGAEALAMFEKAAAAERANAALSDARNVLDRSYQAENDRINDLLSARRDEASELESTISKLESFRDQVKEFRDSLKLDDNLSTLNAQDRVTEAGRQFRELLAKAQGGDEDARGRLTGAAQEYLNEAKGYYQTSTDYGAIFDEVNRALADTQTTTENALSVSQSQLDALKRQITLDEQQLATAKSQYDAILGVNEGVKSLEVAFREYAAAAAAARAAGVTVPGTGGGKTGDINGGWTAGSASGYLAQNKDVAAAIAAGETFGLPAGMAPEVYASAHFGLHGQSEGRKFSNGGFTGMGGVNDVAGVVHGQEYVMDSDTTRALGVPTLDMMRQTRSLPMIAMPASPRMVGSGNDNRGVEQRLDRLETLMRQQIATTGGGLQRVAEAGEAGARATEQRALAERRSANNKQAA